MKTISPFVFGFRKEGLSFSLFEFGSPGRKIPTALFHVEYKWSKNRWYWELFFSNTWRKTC